MNKISSTRRSVIFRFSDAFLITSSFFLINFFHSYDLVANNYILLFVALANFSLVAESMGLYQSHRGERLNELLSSLVNVWIITVGLVILIGYVFQLTHDLPRLYLAYWVLMSMMLMLMLRTLVHKTLKTLRKKGFNTRSVAIVGLEPVGIKLADYFREASLSGFKFIGFFDDRIHSRDRLVNPCPEKLLGDVKELIKSARNGRVDRVYIALPLSAEARVLTIIRELADTNAAVYFVPDFFYLDLLHSKLIPLGDLTTISVYESPHSGIDGWTKRLEDILLVMMILPLVTIPMLLIALLVKLTSPGPVFFKQRRYGVDGKTIKVWKFRTMTCLEDGHEIKQAKVDDVRITPVGRILRRTSLDELPQIINVIIGNMSIVGPRPHAVSHNEEYRSLISGYMLRHKVKPGITGWAQINGWRGETETIDKMKNRIEHDIHYIRNWSLWLDIMIIVRTFRVFISDKAAY